MMEIRLKQLEKLLKKTLALSDDLQFLFDAETNHVNDYETAGDVLEQIDKARKNIIQAAANLISAREAATMGEIQNHMQMKLEELSGAGNDR